MSDYSLSRWADADDDYYWYQKKYVVWDVWEDWLYEYEEFVCYCFGEYEARRWERAGYVVEEPVKRYY